MFGGRDRWDCRAPIPGRSIRMFPADYPRRYGRVLMRENIGFAGREYFYSHRTIEIPQSAERNARNRRGMASLPRPDADPIAISRSDSTRPTHAERARRDSHA